MQHLTADNAAATTTALRVGLSQELLATDHATDGHPVCRHPRDGIHGRWPALKVQGGSEGGITACSLQQLARTLAR